MFWPLQPLGVRHNSVPGWCQTLVEGFLLQLRIGRLRRTCRNVPLSRFLPTEIQEDRKAAEGAHAHPIRPPVLD